MLNWRTCKTVDETNIWTDTSWNSCLNTKVWILWGINSHVGLQHNWFLHAHRTVYCELKRRDFRPNEKESKRFVSPAVYNPNHFPAGIQTAGTGHVCVTCSCCAFLKRQVQRATAFRSQTGVGSYLWGHGARNRTTNWKNSEDRPTLRPTSEAIGDTRRHSFYLLSGVWQNEAECNPKTRTWAAAQHSERWHFINAMKQNPSCLLMTSFREEVERLWPPLLL